MVTCLQDKLKTKRKKSFLYITVGNLVHKKIVVSSHFSSHPKLFPTPINVACIFEVEASQICETRIGWGQNMIFFHFGHLEVEAFFKR